MKKMMWALFWLNLFVCLLSLTFFGVPETVQELVERICRMVIAALSGAALSNLLPVWPDSEGNYCFHRNDTAAEPPKE